jgi:hypothetical protein
MVKKLQSSKSDRTMKRKEYIKPELEIVSVATQSMIAASLPSSPGGTPDIGIKAESFDKEELIDFDKQINGLLW